MRIAQLAPLWVEVPPKKYGGTELIASLITEELVRRGHEVTLFANGESQTKAKLVSIIDRPLYQVLGGFDFKNITYHLLNARLCYQFAKEGRFDIVHNHAVESLLFAPFSSVPTVTTLHSSIPYDDPALGEVVKDENFVSVSNAQRRNNPQFNYVATVYHGIEVEKFEFNPSPKDYLFYLGTIWPLKGVDVAVEVARRTGRTLIMAGDIRSDEETKRVAEKGKIVLPDEVTEAPFIKGFVKPRLTCDLTRKEVTDSVLKEVKEIKKGIVLLPELNFSQKVSLYKDAYAFVFPIRWNEAFGLVVPEAMACGTPVVAFDNGAVPEVVDDGVTGFVVESGDEKGLAKAVAQAGRLNREKIRKVAEEKFSVKRMVDNYEKVYKKILERDV